MTIVKPRVWPRNIFDLFICLPSFIIQILVLFVLPMLIVFMIFGNLLLTIFVVLAIWLYFVIGGVRYLSINDDGITFKRVLGSPKFVSWSELEGVEVSSPLNTIIFGWLWPPIPAREMTYSLSAFEHVQFTYSGGKRTFFPPMEVRGLMSLIEKYKREALINA